MASHGGSAEMHTFGDKHVAGEGRNDTCLPARAGIRRRRRRRGCLCPTAVALTSSQGIDIVARLLCRR
jgi:hypothetical protein